MITLHVRVKCKKETVKLINASTEKPSYYQKSCTSFHASKTPLKMFFEVDSD